MLGSKLARKNQARKLLDSNFTKSKLRKLYFLYICQDFSIMHAKYHQKLCFLTHESLLTNKKWTKNFAGSSIARARSKNLLLEFGSARKVLENFWLETRLGSKNFGSKCSSHENFGSDPSLVPIEIGTTLRGEKSLEIGCFKVALYYPDTKTFIDTYKVLTCFLMDNRSL